jgi:biotin carboxyl carrier protein
VEINREQCSSLMAAVSKSGIDVFELHCGCINLIFHRRETAASADDKWRQESAPSAVEVLSPLLGMCRTAPGDNAPPYVQAGQAVTEQDIICSIDVLEKRFDVTAGTSGIIARLNARSGELVEYKQLLAVIQTAG